MDALYVGVVGKRVLFGSIKAKSAHGLLGYSYAVITPNTRYHAENNVRSPISQKLQGLVVNGYYRM